MEPSASARLQEVRKMRNLFKKNQQSQQESYAYQSKSYTGFQVNIHYIHIPIFSGHILLLNTTAIIKATIPATTLKVNAQILNFGFFVATGNMIAAPNQPADRLINKSAKAPNQIPFIQATLTGKSNTVKVKTLMNDGAVRFGPVTGPP